MKVKLTRLHGLRAALPAAAPARNETALRAQSPASAQKSTSTRKRNVIAGAMGVGALLGATFLFAAPANAAEPAPAGATVTGYCYGVDYDQSNGNVTASCQGAVYISVSCYAVWPYSPWTDERYIDFGGGYSTVISGVWANCPWPAGYDIHWVAA